MKLLALASFWLLASAAAEKYTLCCERLNRSGFREIEVDRQDFPKYKLRKCTIGVCRLRDRPIVYCEVNNNVEKTLTEDRHVVFRHIMLGHDDYLGECDGKGGKIDDGDGDDNDTLPGSNYVTYPDPVNPAIMSATRDLGSAGIADITFFGHKTYLNTLESVDKIQVMVQNGDTTFIDLDANGFPLLFESALDDTRIGFEYTSQGVVRVAGQSGTFKVYGTLDVDKVGQNLSRRAKSLEIEEPGHTHLRHRRLSEITVRRTMVEVHHCGMPTDDAKVLLHAIVYDESGNTMASDVYGELSTPDSGQYVFNVPVNTLTDNGERDEACKTFGPGIKSVCALAREKWHFDTEEGRLAVCEAMGEAWALEDEEPGKGKSDIPTMVEACKNFLTTYENACGTFDVNNFKVNVCDKNHVYPGEFIGVHWDLSAELIYPYGFDPTEIISVSSDIPISPRVPSYLGVAEISDKPMILGLFPNPGDVKPDNKYDIIAEVICLGPNDKAILSLTTTDNWPQDPLIKQFESKSEQRFEYTNILGAPSGTVDTWTLEIYPHGITETIKVVF